MANPFEGLGSGDDLPHVALLDLMRKPENFGFTAKYLFGKQLAPFQMAILREMWSRPFPMLLASRGASKSWLLAVYAMLRGLFEQGRKIVIIGAAFRQAKVVFDYCYDLWESSPVFRDLVGNDKRNGPRRDVDRCSMRLGDSLIIALPLGSGDKIRGQRASILLVEEFSSVPRDIFETVVRGFAAVSMDPVGKFQYEMRKEALKELGLWNDDHERLEEHVAVANQTIISGTAYYTFNHFYDYWKQYKEIIESRGDPKRVAEIFGGETPDKFNWKDYSIVRLPVELVPPGFMDMKQIAQAKATIHRSAWLHEYGAVFAADSNGFFKRSLIESCVTGRANNPISAESCGPVNFRASMKGIASHKYVIAVDPASEHDNFSVVVLECWPDHRRIVHCWTTTRAKYKAKFQRGLAAEGEFYSYTARKLRQLALAFPCSRIAIDSQGGGHAVMEALQDADKLGPSEKPLYPVIDPDNPRYSDGLSGDHIIEVINFAKADWVREANHGMRKDFEDKALLFPEFDPAILELSYLDDKAAQRIMTDTAGDEQRLYDTLEDCVLEIEELKDELATIVYSQTGQTMRDHWDTPETKGAGGKKGRQRKDRYSALLMANMVGRSLARAPVKPAYVPFGGFAKDLGARKGAWSAQGPAWYTESTFEGYGAVVRRGT